MGENITVDLIRTDEYLRRNNYDEAAEWLESAYDRASAYNGEQTQKKKYFAGIRKRAVRIIKKMHADVKGARNGYAATKALELVEELDNRNSSPESGLEGKTAVFALSTLAGIAVSVFSFNATGNAIASVTGTSQGLLGVLLFVVGISGMFFNIRK
jgi:hypothetical protein